MATKKKEETDTIRPASLSINDAILDRTFGAWLDLHTFKLCRP